MDVYYYIFPPLIIVLYIGQHLRSVFNVTLTRLYEASSFFFLICDLLNVHISHCHFGEQLLAICDMYLLLEVPYIESQGFLVLLHPTHYSCYNNYYEYVVVQMYILFLQGLVLILTLDWVVEQFQIAI